MSLLPLLLLCLAVGIAFVRLELPGEGRLVNAMQNSGHGLAFAALTLLSLLSLGLRDAARPGRLVATVSLILFVLGLLIELFQHAGGRGASVVDLGMNSAGIVAGCALAVAARHRGRSAARTLPGIATLPLAGLALLWCLRLPIAIIVVDALAPNLPSLAAFEQPFALAKFAGSSTPAALSLVERDPRWPMNRTIALEAIFPSGVWPGFRLVEPPEDWREYRTLAMRIVNPAPDPLRLRVRVDQRTGGENEFRTAGLELEPGANDVEIDLRSMRRHDIPEGRVAHEPLVAVSQVLVFLSGNRRPVTLLFDDLVLR